MIESRLFEMHSRISMAHMLCDHECALISAACAEAVAREGDDRGAIRGRFDEERGRALAWRDYIVSCIELECGGGLARELPQPQQPCMPRSRHAWRRSLRHEVGSSSDPFLEMLVAFVIGFMIGQITSGQDEQRAERAAFLRELRLRLRYADEEVDYEKEGGVKRRVLVQQGKR